MRFEADPETAEWLHGSPSVEWDTGNSTKSKVKHGFSRAYQESVLEGDFIFLGRILGLSHDEPRYLLVGTTKDGRRAAMVFTRRGDLLRPISCRAQRDSERKAYDGR